MKKIILCADDFGETQAICDGILALVKQQRLSAVSCMSNTPCWQKNAANLIEHRAHTAIGLHFNLPGRILPWLIKSHLGLLKKKRIKHELINQIELFRQAAGFLPDFIDGHQHIHQLPTIRQALIEVYVTYYPERSAFIRNTVGPTRDLKGKIIQHSGSQQLKKLLVSNNAPHNSNFSGIYNFADSKHYRQYFIQFLAEIKNNGLIMCHPGELDRQNELNYFLSNYFTEDLAAQQTKLAKELGDETNSC